MPTGDSAIVFNNPSSGFALTSASLANLIDHIGKYFSVVDVIDRVGLPEALQSLARLVDVGTTIFVLGGDGTIGVVANFLIEQDVDAAIAPIPTGTGNDFTSFVGISKDHNTAVRQLIDGSVHHIDCGMVEWSGPRGSGSHVFVNSFGIGYDARVAENVDRYKSLGSAGYVAAALHTLIGWNNQAGTVVVDDTAIEKTKFMFASVCNGRSSGGGFKLAPEASLVDHQLDYFIMGDISRLMALMLLPAIRLRGKWSSPKITSGRARKLLITFDDPHPIHLDGEIASPATSTVAVRCLPGALSMLLPDGAIT
ncbi:MAG: hypothetical protein HKN43_02570 [Rhodothermales bacterium]|nr:hypothetical protein [Rhodothermales bacterium]